MQLHGSFGLAHLSSNGKKSYYYLAKNRYGGLQDGLVVGFSGGQTSSPNGPASLLIIYG